MSPAPARSRLGSTLLALAMALSLMGMPMVLLSGSTPLGQLASEDRAGAPGASVSASAVAPAVATVEAPSVWLSVTTGVTGPLEQRVTPRDLPEAVDAPPVTLGDLPNPAGWVTPQRTVVAASADLAPTPVQRGPPQATS
ncbi:hypothetical protein RIF23_08670 [Lipingzhangella sp. LS1_29]|uniref:Uncharacterized protein n=1 Tax=Lipingzhangella rawalii TaxID=2055835 RepID=A0ABU2H6A9_9ACTN|nr:hypothetical protein [Lipingzhangella rawalii]MDS1270365.1 hypothetical protein [Lipingzhangella rawalii]